MDLLQFQRRLAERVRALREARGLSQESIAEHGLSPQGLQKIEYGETDPKASTLLALCRAYEVSLRDLLDFESPVRKPRRSRQVR